MRILLLQIRDAHDLMASHEFKCFQEKISRFKDCQVEVHSLLLEEYHPTLSDWDVFLVGGSGNYGLVNNTSDWYLRAQQLLCDIVEAGQPLFCSCFGHQALAAALGGEVITDRSRSELGTFSLNLTDPGRQDPLFGQLPDPFTAQLGHNDHVVKLPNEAIHLARSQNSDIQAYRLRNRPVYATQFHPELSHAENAERAGGYLHVYSNEQQCPEGLARAFQPSPHAEDLIPRFLQLLVDGKV